jgi:hypothetical protein
VTKTQPSETHTTIASLPQVVLALILGPHNLPDPIDLARFLVVNRAMRDAVKATWRQVREMNAWRAEELGCLGTLKHLYSRGRLIWTHSLCSTAARSGQLEVLRWARANGAP